MQNLRKSTKNNRICPFAYKICSLQARLTVFVDLTVDLVVDLPVDLLHYTASVPLRQQTTILIHAESNTFQEKAWCLLTLSIWGDIKP